MNELEVTLALEKAVIYPECAGLTRAGEVQFAPGDNRVIIHSLPEFLTEDSVRMELAPASQLKIEEVYAEDRILPAYDENLYRKTKTELDALLHKRNKLEASHKNYLDEFALFCNKESITSTLENQLHTPLFAQNWEAFLNFLEEKLKTNRDKARELLFGWLELQRQIEAAQANLEKYAAYEQVKEHRIIVLIKAPAQAKEVIRLYYLQPGVQWHPAYRVRAEIETKRIAISLYAMISQGTGEDWKDLAIELSTAIPMFNCDIPTVYSRLIQEQSAEIVMKERMDSEDKKDMSRSVEMALDEDAAACEESIVPEPKIMARKAPMLAKVMDSRAKKKESFKSESMGRMAGAATTLASTLTKGGAPPPPMQKSVVSADKAPSRGLDGLELLANLVTEAEQEVLPGFTLAGLSALYQQFYQYLNVQYQPESQVPGAGAYRINPWFAKGTSPLASLGGYDYRYVVGSRRNFIPSIQAPVQLGVDIRDMGMELVYVTIPYADEAVFLKALFTNAGPGPLPAGPAQVFVENTFIGNIGLATLGRNMGTALSLGVEKDIKVKRTATSKRRTTGLVAKGILVDFTVEIELTSYKEDAVTIEVYDRLPQSKSVKEITVPEESFAPEPWKITDDKVIVWKILAERGVKQVLKMNYTIKHPENYQLELSEGSQVYTGEEAENG